MMSNFKTKNNKGAAALIITTLFMIISLAMVAGFFTLALSQSRIASNVAKSTKAYYAAESAIEDIAYAVNNNLTPPTNTNVGDVPVSITFNNESATYITKAIIGDIIRKISITQPTATGFSVSFPYIVQAGYMGLEMKQEASVRDGDVYSNGPITGDNTAVISNAIIKVARGFKETSSYYKTEGVDDTSTVSALPVRDVSGRRFIIQQFVPEHSGKLGAIGFYLNENSTNAAQIDVNIFADADGVTSVSGQPDPVISGTNTSYSNGTINRSQVGTAPPNWFVVPLTSPKPLIAGQPYWIRIGLGGGQNATEFFKFYGASPSNYSDNAWRVWYSIDNSGNLNTTWKTAVNSGSPTVTNTGLLYRLYFGEQNTSFASVQASNTGSACSASEFRSKIYANTFNVGSTPAQRAELYYRAIPAPTNIYGSCPPATMFSDDSTPEPKEFPISRAVLEQWVEDIKGPKMSSNPDVYANQCTGGVECDGFGSKQYPTNDFTPKDAKQAIYFPGDVTITNGATLTLKTLMYVKGDLTVSGTDAKQCKIKLDASGGVFGGGRSGYIIVDGKVTIDRCAFEGAEAGSRLVIISRYGSTSGTPAIQTKIFAVMGRENKGSVLYAPNGYIDLQGPNTEFEGVYGAQVRISNSASESSPEVSYQASDPHEPQILVFPSITETTQTGLSFWRETAY